MESVLTVGYFPVTVYCESCLIKQMNGPLKCQVCDSLHPGNLPKVCLEMDQFLEEQFPNEYLARCEHVRSMKSQSQQGEASFSKF